MSKIALKKTLQLSIWYGSNNSNDKKHILIRENLSIPIY